MDGAKDIAAPALYDEDFYAWAQAQAEALRARDADAIDWDNVIEEIETLGRSEKRSLRSALRLIIEHRLKLDYGQDRAPERGWRITVEDQRGEVADLLADNPSLRPLIPALIEDEYADPREAALDSFEEREPERLAAYRAALPEACPYGEGAVLG